MINWKVRFRNKSFWTSIIPAILVFVHVVLDLFGVDIDLGDLGNKLLAIVDAVFIILAILGIVTDPTTEGRGDSLRALGYEKPYKDEIETDE